MARLDGLRLDSKIAAFKTFEELYDFVADHNISHLGPCNRYDFCLRYGYTRGLRPREFVYVHRGSRRGAWALRALGLMTFPNDAFRIPVRDFPPLLRRCDPTVIEDFLCVKDGALLDLAVRKIRNL